MLDVECSQRPSKRPRDRAIPDSGAASGMLIIPSLQFNPSPQLDDAIGWDVEIVRDASGVARHCGKDSAAQKRQPFDARSGDQLLTRQEIGDVHRFELQALRTTELERESYLGLLHEAVSRGDTPAVVPQTFALDAVLGFDPRDVLQLDRHKDVLLVEHLVMLEAVQQRIGCHLGCRRQEHRRTWYALRWKLEQRFEEAFQRR